MSGRNDAGADTESKEMKEPRPSAGSTQGPGGEAVRRTVLANLEPLRNASLAGVESIGLPG